LRCSAETYRAYDITKAPIIDVFIRSYRQPGSISGCGKELCGGGRANYSVSPSGVYTCASI
jgi:hypothetical protein